MKQCGPDGGNGLLLWNRETAFARLQAKRSFIYLYTRGMQITRRKASWLKLRGLDGVFLNAAFGVCIRDVRGAVQDMVANNPA